MANKSKKGNKSLIAGICCGLVVIAVVVAVVVIALVKNGGVNDDYFKSDNTKLVMSLDGNSIALDDDDLNLVKFHQVYTYEGDTITSSKAYYEFEDNAAANKAKEYIEESLKGQEEVDEVYVDGKYLVVVANKSTYENNTT